MGNRNYILDIEVGGHPITVLPDTGSFSLMVTSSRCPKSKCDFPKGFELGRVGSRRGHSSCGTSGTQKRGCIAQGRPALCPYVDGLRQDTPHPLLCFSPLHAVMLDDGALRR